MKITKVTILERPGHTDRIFLETDLPYQFPKVTEFDSDSFLTLTFECTKGHGKGYVRENFDIEPHIIEG